jgi:HEAT repeat protein
MSGRSPTRSAVAPGSASSEEVIKVLSELVQSGDGARKREAAWGLGRFGSAAAAAIPPLIQMAKEVDSPRNQEAAAEALSLIAVDNPAADQVVTVLMAVLESKSGAARVAAIEALARFGPKGKSAIPKIRALRGDPDGDVKRAATDAVTKLEAVSTPWSVRASAAHNPPGTM